ncbi:MAG TPA: hypothetical protein DCM28_11650 [Phycisphaerales bacterium]|nr:hypothetical protein [Phycisphaerales bacterium]HCD35232.1 hypothetical protein [Phycisphaerales bacterium]
MINIQYDIKPNRDDHPIQPDQSQQSERFADSSPDGIVSIIPNVWVVLQACYQTSLRDGFDQIRQRRSR